VLFFFENTYTLSNVHELNVGKGMLYIPNHKRVDLVDTFAMIHIEDVYLNLTSFLFDI
jgi:hypothetical protein